MWKATILNIKSGKVWGEGSLYDTEELAQAWLDKQVGKPERLPERIVSVEDDYDQEDVLEVIQSEVDGEMQDTHVRLCSQYIPHKEDITAAYELEQSKIAARKYLAETDWYAIRKADTGAAIPEEIAALRQAARELL